RAQSARAACRSTGCTRVRPRCAGGRSRFCTTCGSPGGSCRCRRYRGTPDTRARLPTASPSCACRVRRRCSASVFRRAAGSSNRDVRRVAWLGSGRGAVANARAAIARTRARRYFAAETAGPVMVVYRWVLRQTLLFVCLGMFAGCAAATDPAPSPAPGAGGNASTQATRERVLTACTDFATRLCEDSADCCRKVYTRYDQAGCVATLLRDLCRPGADAVAAGFAVYDEQFVEPCLAAHAQADAVCVPTWQDNLTLRKSLWAACKVLRGTTESGRSCSTDVTCAEPDGAKAGVCVRGICQVLEVLAEGDPCPFQSGTVSTCDVGLYCTATMNEP